MSTSSIKTNVRMVALINF